MTGLTDAGEKLVLNALFRNTGTLPTNIYIGLATNTSGSLDETALFTDLIEVDDPGYERKEVIFDTPEIFNNAQAVKNSTQIEFGPWAEDEDAGITYAFLTDSQTGTTGTLLALYPFASAKNPFAGEAQIVTQGSCIFSLD